MFTAYRSVRISNKLTTTDTTSKRKHKETQHKKQLRSAKSTLKNIKRPLKNQRTALYQLSSALSKLSKAPLYPVTNAIKSSGGTGLE